MKNFYNPTKGQMTLQTAVSEIVDMMESDPQFNYSIVVGTDSHAPAEDEEVDFVSAIVVHKVGHGGRYFWKREHLDGIYTLRDKIYKEATLSFNLGKTLMDKLENQTFFDYNLEIHIDVGQNGQTREIIDEVVGMIVGSGFEVKTKPEAYGASSVADKHA